MARRSPAKSRHNRVKAKKAAGRALEVQPKTNSNTMLAIIQSITKDLACATNVEKILAVEKHLLSLGTTESVEFELKHRFIEGVYARELFIPKGTLLTGAIHKQAQVNIISAGDISVLTAEGVIRVQAPYTIISPPGVKRLGYAHTDTVWTTILHTNERDVAVIEDTLIAKSFADFDQFLLEGGTKSWPLSLAQFPQQ